MTRSAIDSSLDSLHELALAILHARRRLPNLRAADPRIAEEVERNIRGEERVLGLRLIAECRRRDHHWDDVSVRVHEVGDEKRHQGWRAEVYQKR